MIQIGNPERTIATHFRVVDQRSNILAGRDINLGIRPDPETDK